MLICADNKLCQMKRSPQHKQWVALLPFSFGPQWWWKTERVTWAAVEPFWRFSPLWTPKPSRLPEDITTALLYSTELHFQYMPLSICELFSFFTKRFILMHLTPKDRKWFPFFVKLINIRIPLQQMDCFSGLKTFLFSFEHIFLFLCKIHIIVFLFDTWSNFTWSFMFTS